MVTKKPTTGSSKAGVAKKVKQGTQRTPQQRVMVLGKNGKIRFEWRAWGA